MAYTPPAVTDATIPFDQGFGVPVPWRGGAVYLFTGTPAILPRPLVEKVAAWFSIQGAALTDDPNPLVSRRLAERYTQEIMAPNSNLVVAVAPVWRGVIVGLGRFTLRSTRTATLHDLVVDPAFLRTGLGRILTEARIHTCREYGATHVETHILPCNAASVALHQRLGFLPGVPDAPTRAEWWHLPLSAPDARTPGETPR